jgi:hypothetical protein
VRKRDVVRPHAVERPAGAASALSFPWITDDRCYDSRRGDDLGMAGGVYLLPQVALDALADVDVRGLGR